MEPERQARAVPGTFTRFTSAQSPEKSPVPGSVVTYTTAFAIRIGAAGDLVDGHHGRRELLQARDDPRARLARHQAAGAGIHGKRK